MDATARIDPSTGDGIVLLESGHPLLAALVAGSVFWQTGTIDFVAFTLVAKDMLAIIRLGWGAIILAALFIGWRRSRRRRWQIQPNFQKLGALFAQIATMCGMKKGPGSGKSEVAVRPTSTQDYPTTPQSRFVD